ncbi:MAG: adaptor protein MecA [Lactobacillus sp.]|jgi:adapter protein MecA 1/2|nr:adaptor protein MecA [Lactobacillus sp.]MCI2031794.1 adaptor protein MecA [Lactobacillus sp.]
MEMERINDNTIRVLLGNEDLAERGITVLDLLGNHQQIESFFYSILDEVDKDHSFATNDAVTFQVMPSQSGLELLISKNVNQDDDSSQDDQPQAQDVPDFIKRQLMATDDDHDAVDEGGYIDDNGAAQTEVVLKLASFEDLIALAKTLRLEGAASDLYHYQEDYYLVLTFYSNQVSEQEIKDQLAVALEYGDRSNVSAAKLSEYGQKVMATSALETARYYFK